MTATSAARLRLLGHGLLGLMFALGGLWAVRRAWGLIESGATGPRLIITSLALLGFLSLALHEVRALALAVRSARGA